MLPSSSSSSQKESALHTFGWVSDPVSAPTWISHNHYLPLNTSTGPVGLGAVEHSTNISSDQHVGFWIFKKSFKKPFISSGASNSLCHVPAATALQILWRQRLEVWRMESKAGLDANPKKGHSCSLPSETDLHRSSVPKAALVLHGDFANPFQVCYLLIL